MSIIYRISGGDTEPEEIQVDDIKLHEELIQAANNHANNLIKENLSFMKKLKRLFKKTGSITIL